MSGITYSYDFYLRNIYASNRFARKSANRSSLCNIDLMKADTSAMDKICNKLRELEYSSDNGTTVLNHAKLLVETYNNLLDSTHDSDADSISRLSKQLSSYTKEQKSALESIGITIGASEKLSLNKTTFAKCSPSKIEKVLGKDNDFTKQLTSYAKKIKRAAGQLPLSETTDSGSSSTTTIATNTLGGTNTHINVIV